MYSFIHIFVNNKTHLFVAGGGTHSIDTVDTLRIYY